MITTLPMLIKMVLLGLSPNHRNKQLVTSEQQLLYFQEDLHTNVMDFHLDALDLDQLLHEIHCHYMQSATYKVS